MLMRKKMLLAIALLVAAIAPNASPAAAHYDDWHRATCQGQWLLLYNWPSSWSGQRVIYWTSPTGEMPLDAPELHVYAQQGYECGWMGAMIAPPWGQQVCEFGYCGVGIINAFANGWMARHFHGPAAGWVAVYNR
jgi:hypothetical protein